jgi:NAD(P)-dependent dehydrogenase (short-subunit alcohol dehydrogenase family)
VVVLVVIFSALRAQRGSRNWEWKDKVVVMTGASMGIGKEMALILASKGAKLALAARSDGLKDTVEECVTKLGGKRNFVHGIVTDVTNENDCRKLIEESISKFGRIDCLILNAGIGGDTPLDEVKDFHLMRKLMDVNYWGAVYCAVPAIPHLLKLNDSRILVMSSLGGIAGLPNASAYSGSKSALHGFFEGLKIELEDRCRVAVTIATPGPVKTILSHGMDPRECADGLLDSCARGDRYYIPNPGIMKLAPILKLFLPAMVDKMLKKRIKRKAE